MNQTLGKFDEHVFLQCERLGMSAREIAERFGVTSRTVVRWRNLTNLNHQTPGEPHSAEDRELARRLIEDGCSFEEAARTVGVAASTIRTWFPGIRGWTKQQAGEHAALIRRMNRTLERNAA